MKSNSLSWTGTAAAIILVSTIVLGSFAAWLTHIFVCIRTGAWAFLIAGAVFFPVAVIHGIGLWFGAW